MDDPKSPTSLSDFKKESGVLLTDLLKSVNRHNMQSFRETKAMAERALGKRPPKADTPQADNQNVPDGMLELVSQNATALERFGLVIVPHIGSLGQSTEWLNFRVEDATAFLRTLQSLSPGSVPIDPLETLVKDIGDQLASTVVAINPRDTLLLQNLAPICAAFKKLLPEIDLERLERYGKFYASGQLREYLIVENKGLLRWVRESGTGGPTSDRVPAPLIRDRRFWDAAISTLREQEKLAECGVSKQLKESLIECLKISIEDFENTPSPKDVPRDFEAKFQAETQHVIKEYKNQLDPEAAWQV